MTHISYSIRQENCEDCNVSQEECLAGSSRCLYEIITKEMDIDKITFEIKPDTREIVAILLCAAGAAKDAEPVRISPLLLKNIANTETGHVLIYRRDMRGAKIYERSVRHRDEFECEFVIRK